jgi:hypothetical protein
MLVIYKPEDENGTVRQDMAWEKEFQPTRVRANRAEMIEKRYGSRYADWVNAIQAGEVKARRVLMWHLLSLDHPSFKMEDVPDFMFGELELDYSLADLQKLRVQVDESAMDDTAKSETLERLDMEIATRLVKGTEELTAEDLGKAHTPSGTAASDS